MVYILWYSTLAKSLYIILIDASFVVCVLPKSLPFGGIEDVEKDV